MPLQTRRPELAQINVPAPCFDSIDPQTPLPSTPMLFANCHPMILTPTPGAFDLDLDELNSRMIGLKRSRPPASPVIASVVVHEPQLEWDSREDGIVQSFLTHPLHPLSTPFPPSTLPPPGALDELASQIMHYHRPPHPSISSSTSLPTLSDIAAASGPIPLPENGKPKTRARAATTVGWKHSWAATRQRLFELARKESKQATGGVSKRSRGQKPELTRNNSMAFLDLGDEIQTGFGEVLRLSTSLQRSSNGTGPSGGLAGQSLNGLSSPLSFSPVSSRRGSIVNGAFPATQQKSLLSRGKSFTADDFESYVLTAREPTSPSSGMDTEDEHPTSPEPVRRQSKPQFNMSFTPVYRDHQDESEAPPVITLTVQSPSPTRTRRTRRPGRPMFEPGTPSRSPSPSPAFSTLSLGSPRPSSSQIPAQQDKKRQRMLAIDVPPSTGWTDAGLQSPFDEGPARRIAF